MLARVHDLLHDLRPAEAASPAPDRPADHRRLDELGPRTHHCKDFDQLNRLRPNGPLERPIPWEDRRDGQARSTAWPSQRYNPSVLDRRRLMDGALLLLPALISPLLLFPRIEWIWISLSAPLLWIADWLATGRLLNRTPFNSALACLLFTALVSVFATFDLNLSLSKLAGLLLGVFVCFGVIRFARSQGRLLAAAGLFCAGGAGLGLVSLIATRWPSKFSLFSFVSDLLPTRFKGLPGAEEGFSANAVGGSVILFIPLLFTLTSILARDDLGLGRLLRRLLIVTAAAAGAFLSAILLASQSRGAWLGMAVVLAAAAMRRFPALRWAGAAGGLMILALLAVLGPSGMVELATSEGEADADDVGLAGRLELWQRALLGIQDFPYTGMGMNVFRVAGPALYPLFEISPQVDIASAHNHLLQTALDLGLPGLTAYAALWAAAAGMLMSAGSGSTGPAHSKVALGLGLGLLAQFTFQITDAIPLGAKAGLFFWVAMGLAASLWRLGRPAHSSPRCAVLLAEVLPIWAAGSLTAAWLAQWRPLLGVTLAAAAGAAMGFRSVILFRNALPDDARSETPSPPSE